MTCVSCASSETGARRPARGQGPRGSSGPRSAPARRAASQYDPIAELYDGYPGNYLEDILFFVEEARVARPRPVLEVGVGTGRLAFCLASVGIAVVGIDSSPAMLRVLARRRAGLSDLPGQVRALAADVRAFALRQRFPLAIIPFRAFLHLLTRSDQRRALRAIRRHLEPGGRLVMSFFVPPPDLLSRGRTDRREMARFAAPEGDGEVVAFDWAEFVPARRRVISHITYEWRDAGGLATRYLQHDVVARYAFPEEIPPLLEGCGYRVVAAYGGFDRSPLTPESREQIWVAEALGGPVTH